jgi:hypothetical protein
MPAGVSAYTPLANITLSSSASSVTISSITAGYRDLVIVLTGEGGNGDFYPRLRFNGDTASNYSGVFARGDGSATFTYASTENGLETGSIYASISDSVQITWNIMDFSATDKHKSVLVRGDRANQMTTMFAGRWASTSAITSIQLFSSNGNTLAAGTTLAVYGIASA